MTGKDRVEEARVGIFKILFPFADIKRQGDVDLIDQILSLKDKDGKPMLAILSEDQSLPKCPHPGVSTYGEAQKHILASNFRRVIIEEE